MSSGTDNNEYYEWNDGWFTYYINNVTGKKKFNLEDGDKLVSQKFDDFCR